MKEPAMKTKLLIRPVIGCLTHSHYWEGPCRAGRYETMTQEAENAMADRLFKDGVKRLQDLPEQYEILEAVNCRYDESKGCSTIELFNI